MGHLSGECSALDVRNFPTTHLTADRTHASVACHPAASGRLTLTANSLGSLKGARQLTSLEHLLVQQNAITGVADLALEELAELPKLQSLYLVRPLRAACVCRHRMAGFDQSWRLMGGGDGGWR